MTNYLKILWLRHLPISEEQFLKQALAFDARKYVVSHYKQVVKFEH